MFQLQPTYIGLEIGKSSIRLAVLRKIGNRWSLSLLKEISKEENIHLFYDQFKEGLLISALQTRDVLMRPCEIPLKKTKDIFAALDFHVEPLLPYPLDKAIIQAQIASRQTQATLLNVFAIRKDHLSLHLEALKHHRFEPEIVTTRPHAFAALSTLLPQTGAPFLIVHEGEEELSILFLEKGEVLFARSIDIKKDLTTEIQKTFLSFAAAHKEKTFESIYFFGKNQELKNTLQTIGGKPLYLPSAPSLTLTQEELIHFGLAIGTALAHKEVNFRQKELSYPHRLKRLKKPLVTYFTLATLLACAFCAFAETSLFQKKQVIEESYLALLKSEKISALDHPTRKTPQDYFSSLDALEKRVKERPETFPLLPQVPKVKEIVSWLTALARPHGKESSPIEIESLHYQMVKRPDFPHKQERYKVRVELEFSAKDPNAARTFQEALKNANLFVDTEEEIQWHPAKGKYKTSFFLKDKTRYG
jgi:type IV pilus assembly protein PilM